MNNERAIYNIALRFHNIYKVLIRCEDSVIHKISYCDFIFSANALILE